MHVAGFHSVLSGLFVLSRLPAVMVGTLRRCPVNGGEWGNMPVLDWIGKQAVINHHQEVPYQLLHCDSDLSAGDPNSGNLIVEGDNLKALKALLPYYKGQVDCIFIDPPYNTGNEGWTYNDNVNSPEMKEWLGKVVGKEEEDLSRHDKWLCMMYPRLKLLKEFLKHTGSIWMTLDDYEAHRGKLLLDEIFGVQNFVANVIWQKKHTRANDARWFSDNHDHVICFAKNKTSWNRNLLKRNDEQDSSWTNEDNDPRGVWASGPCHVKTPNERDIYEVTLPSGRKLVPPAGTSWRFSRKKFEQLIRENRIYFGKSGNNVPRYKRFLSEVQDGLVPVTLWTHSDVGHNQDAKKQIIDIGLLGQFDTPKPIGLIKQIFEISTHDKALVMDSFAGSGTTAHAVMEANKLDGGNRRFILVEMEEGIATTVTAERVKRVIDGYEYSGTQKTELHSEKLTWGQLKKEDFHPAEIINQVTESHRGEFEKIRGEVKDNTLRIFGENVVEERTEGLGGGFRYCTLGTPLFNEFGDISEAVSFPDLAAHIFFSETGSPLPKKVDGTSSLIGQFDDKIVHLLFSSANQGFPREAAGNVLTPDMLRDLPLPPDGFDGKRVVYAEGCTVSNDRLRDAGVVFKHIPYQIEGAK